MAKLIFNYPFMKKEYDLEKFGKNEIYIGRIERNDITIPDYNLFKKLPPGTQRLYINDLVRVSRIHARFTKQGDKWFLEDIGTKGLGSNFGTYVNEARLEVKKPYLLQNNDKIKFGPVDCTFVENTKK
ncbi:FHA domain-containing protein [bacterium]|nr:FHA domain-containing protein [bacterium]